MKSYDICIIGTGTAGYTLAHICRKAGRKVAIADSRPMGGTCAMRGCQPKKYLVTAAEIVGISRSLAGKGISPGPGIDWESLMRAKNNFTDAVPEDVEKSFVDAGIDVFHGTASFVSPEKVMLGDETCITATNFVVATGSRPAPLQIPGEEHVATSEQFLNLPSLPKRILFIGGGYISLEFAHVARLAGSDVTILQSAEHIMTHFDAELVEQLTASAEDLGIRIITNFKVCEVQPVNSSYRALGDEKCTSTYEADMVVHGAGRSAAMSGLELDAGDIAFSPQGIVVNDFLQSPTNPRVYAVGDVIAKSMQLSPVADMEAEVAADNILNGNRTRADYGYIPTVVFSFPPLAKVGMTEAEAASSGLRYQVNKGSMASWPSSLRIGQKKAFYKVLLENETGRILGAHIFSHNAGEIINVFAMAMKFSLNNKDLKKVLWAYPTSTSDLKYMIR